jgi:phosphoribosylglycinamide formyltransferase 2
MSGARVSSGRVIIEQFVPFDYEITLLTVRSVDPASGEGATWFCEPIGHRQDRGDYVESWQPAQMTTAALESARSVAARITGALGGRGVFGGGAVREGRRRVLLRGQSRGRTTPGW